MAKTTTRPARRPPPPVGEEKIIWLVPVTDLPKYVRERVEDLLHRTGISKRMQLDGRVVGYSELHADAPALLSRRGFFRRRVFYVLPYEPATRDGEYPCDAVDPRLVRAGVASPYYHYQADI